MNINFVRLAIAFIGLALTTGVMQQFIEHVLGEALGSSLDKNNS
jgi:hypothetical protein